MHKFKIPNNEMSEASNFGSTFEAMSYAETCQICVTSVKENSHVLCKLVVCNLEQTLICNKLYLCCSELNLREHTKLTLCANCFEVVNTVNRFMQDRQENQQSLNCLASTIKLPKDLDFFNISSYSKIKMDGELKTEHVDLPDTESAISHNGDNLERDTFFRRAKCTKCSYRNSISARRISVSEHEKEPFTCNQCSNKRSKKINLKKPLQTLPVKKLQKCLKCDYSYEGNNQLKVNMCICTSRKNAGKKPFKCLHCGYSCTRQNHLQTHILIHSGEKPFKCPQCDFKSAHKMSLTAHMYIHSGENPFKCSQCDFKSRHKKSLRLHMYIHTGEKPFKCSYCSYSSIQKHHLKNHLFSHTGEKPFKCSHCDFKSVDKMSLKAHMYIHSGEKRFKCLQCDFKSVHKKSLKGHMYIHTGEKPFKCLHCDFKSIQKYTLKRHIRIHTGEKPYKCLYCNYSSVQKGQLQNHVFTHIRKKL